MAEHRQELVLDAVGLRQVVLALAQGVFGSFAVGDIPRGAGDRFNFAVDVEDRYENVVVEASALRAGERHFASDGLSGCDDMVDFAVVHRCMPRLVAEFETVFANRLIRRLAPHREQRLVGVGEPMIAVEDVNQVRRIGQNRFIETTLLIGRGRDACERLLAAFPVGDVPRRAKPLDDLPVSVEDWHGARERPAQRSVDAEDAMLQFEGGFCVDRFAAGGKHHRVIVGMNVLVDPAAARIQRIGDEIAAVEMPHLGPVRVHAVDDVRGRRYERPKPLLRGGDDIPRANQRRDVLEITDDAEASIRKLNADDPPLVILHGPAVDPVLGTFGRDRRLAGLERIPEDAHDFVRVIFRPQAMDDVVEIAVDEVGNRAEHMLGRGVDIADPKILIDEINPQRRVVEHALDLRHAAACRLASLRPLPLRFDARQQILRRKRLHEVIVGAGGDAFEGGRFAGSRREQDDRNTARERIGAQRRHQFEAVHLRHHHVGDDHIGPAIAGSGQRGHAVCHGLDLPALSEQPADVVAHVGVVVGKQNASLLRLRLFDRYHIGLTGIHPSQRLADVSVRTDRR